MGWYLTVAATAFSAGIGWSAAGFLWAALEALLFDDGEDDDY